MGRLTKGTEREAEILAVARETLVTGGVDGFVLRTIAERCGIKLGNLQYYFATRDDLLEALLLAEAAADLGVLRARRSDNPELDLRRTIGELIERWGATGQTIYLPIAALSVANPRLRDRWSTIYHSFYDAVGELVQRIDTAATQEETKIRAMKITALLDGAFVQAHVELDHDLRAVMAAEFLAETLRIARGSRDPMTVAAGS
ncbi:MAG: TetR/AcrR family transcriptional regulator [Actinomycetota bacterium]